MKPSIYSEQKTLKRLKQGYAGLSLDTKLLKVVVEKGYRNKSKVRNGLLCDHRSGDQFRRRLHIIYVRCHGHYASLFQSFHLGKSRHRQNNYILRLF